MNLFFLIKYHQTETLHAFYIFIKEYKKPFVIYFDKITFDVYDDMYDCDILQYVEIKSIISEDMLLFVEKFFYDLYTIYR